MKIAGATLNQTPLDWKGNIQNVRSAILDARNAGVELLCLPELAITGYGCEDLFLSQWLPQKSLSLLEDLISDVKDIIIVIGTPYRLGRRLYNTSCVIKNGEVLGFYAKQHLANDGVHYEPRWFSAWKSGDITQVEFAGRKVDFGDQIFELAGIRVGIEICEDAWVEDELRPACTMLEKKVDLILNPSASHFAMRKSSIRQHIVEHSSAAFNCAYLHLNMLGNEAGRMIYDGEIMLGFDGKLLAKNQILSFRDYNILSYEIDFDDPTAVYTPLQIQSLTPEEEFVQAGALGLFDYLRKSRSRGFVLSVSGGADSSACAILVSEMVRRGVRELGTRGFLEKLGRDDLFNSVKELEEPQAHRMILNEIFTCAYQATRHSSEETLNSARSLVESIGAKFFDWSIDDEVTSYTSKIESALGRKLTWEQDDIALQNIQSRSRSPIIWMLANIQNALLITTSNRSEGGVGYATMDGDTSGSIAPIAAVHKHFIRNWLVWAEKELDYPALSLVNKLNPTAELRPHEQTQTDEADLMPYFILVEIEILAIRNYKSPMEVFEELRDRQLEPESLLKKHIIKFFRLWSRNQWKRERLAPSFHLDDFNVDPKTWYRFPIISRGFEEELKELEEM
jgi:NAD+ synthase (glutamine-hydrolysing)